MQLFLDSSVSKESSCNAEDPCLIPGPGRCAGEGTGYPPEYSWASLVAQLVKNPPAIQETWVQSLVWEDPLERGNLPTPAFWPGECHGPYSPWGCKECRHDWETFTFTFTEEEVEALHWTKLHKSFKEEQSRVKYLKCWKRKKKH